MASEGSLPEKSGFLSDKDLEDIFKRDKPFGTELEPQTIARLDWMVTRHRAAYLVIASELGIDLETASKLSTAQHILSRYFTDFVSTGIDAEHNVPLIKHPLDEVMNDLVDDITEPRGFESAIDTLGPVIARMNEVLNGTDEALLHSLDQLRRKQEE